MKLRASSFGSCIRAQVAAQLGMRELPTPEKVQGWYDRGNEHEGLCINAMTEDGWVFDDTHWPEWDDGQAFIAIPGDGWEITGHLDGIAHHIAQAAQDRVVEIKAPATWERFEKAYRTADFSDPYMNRIAWQVSVYMAATGLECIMACWDEEYGVRTFGIEVAPYSASKVRHRAGDIASWVEQGQLPFVCTSSDYPCPFAYLHDDGPEIVDDFALDALADIYEAGRVMETGGKKMKEDARDRLLAHGGGVTESWKVTVSTQSRSSLDEDAMRADGVNVEKYRKAGKASQKVTVTKRGT